ncbi:MAG: hypothetical protein GXY76_20845 [Chloroflexi bacterium]|nr:hypothetical protein [Chloroflexota bacterium]
MPFNVLKSRWDDVRKRIKARWGNLISDADLEMVRGDRVALINLIVDQCNLDDRVVARELDRMVNDIGGNEGGRRTER